MATVCSCFHCPRLDGSDCGQLQADGQYLGSISLAHCDTPILCLRKHWRCLTSWAGEARLQCPFAGVIYNILGWAASLPDLASFKHVIQMPMMCGQGLVPAIKLLYTV